MTNCKKILNKFSRKKLQKCTFFPAPDCGWKVCVSIIDFPFPPRFPTAHRPTRENLVHINTFEYTCMYVYSATTFCCVVRTGVSSAHSRADAVFPYSLPLNAVEARWLCQIRDFRLNHYELNHFCLHLGKRNW